MPDDLSDEAAAEALERDAVDHVWLFVRARTMQNQGTSSANALRPAIDAYFKDKPIGHELYDEERGVGLRLDNGSGRRYLDFEDAPSDLIEWAAKAGLFELNIKAYEGALASSDLRTQHLAQQLALHVRHGRGTQLTTLQQRENLPVTPSQSEKREQP